MQGLTHMRTLVPTVALLAACSDYAVSGSPDDPEGGASPDIAVSPGRVEFGEMAVDDQVPGVETVEVSNLGDAPLEITAMYLEDTAAPFTIGGLSSLRIDPGAASVFTVTFEPRAAGIAAGRVVIESDDGDEPEIHVDLEGTGLAPEIQIDPASHAFGAPYVGCEATTALRIRNVGNAPLVVRDLAYVTASEDLALDELPDENGALPWSVDAGGYVDVEVVYAPLDERRDEGVLNITSNDPRVPIAQAGQSGEGVRYDGRRDAFEQPIQGLADIVFVLDLSCSMYDDIRQVEDNFEVFIRTLATLDTDYQVSVVTDDDGCVNGDPAYIDNSIPASDQVDRFDEMIDAGVAGALTELGFSTLEAALSDEALAGCNAGMIRPDATLALVGVTDEAEQSASPWSDYVTLFQGLKEDPDDVVLHAIAGDYPSGCGDNAPGDRWYQATSATGGLFLSICATDWASHLESIAERSAADLSTFELTESPVPESIVVRVDGADVGGGWVYDPALRAVVFDAASIPAGGAIIEVEYALYGDCG